MDKIACKEICQTAASLISYFSLPLSVRWYRVTFSILFFVMAFIAFLARWRKFQFWEPCKVVVKEKELILSPLSQLFSSGPAREVCLMAVVHAKSKSPSWAWFFCTDQHELAPLSEMAHVQVDPLQLLTALQQRAKSLLAIWKTSTAKTPSFGIQWNPSRPCYSAAWGSQEGLDH